MTTLDFILITVGLIVVILSATQGLIRILMMFFGFYVICIAAGMVTLAAEIVQRLATTIAVSFGSPAPSLAMAQLMVFLCVLIPLYIGTYFITKVAFGDTTLPELKGFDNVLGAGVGVLLALVIMAVLCNTWGVAATAYRQNQTDFWRSMQAAYYGSALRPSMLQVMSAYQMLLFIFQYLDYPPFFVPVW